MMLTMARAGLWLIRRAAAKGSHHRLPHRQKQRRSLVRPGATLVLARGLRPTLPWLAGSIQWAGLQSYRTEHSRLAETWIAMQLLESNWVDTPQPDRTTRA